MTSLRPTTRRLLSTAPTTLTGAKWLPLTRQRIGKLIYHGLTSEDAAEAHALCKVLATRWRGIVAGSEGFCVQQAGLARVPVVWGNMDSMGHVNNVVYARWCESGRVGWVRKLAMQEKEREKREKWMQLVTPKGTGMILKSLGLAYKFPIEYPDRVTVMHKVKDMEEDTFSLDVMILSEKHQRQAARCSEVIVMYDYPSAKKVPIPEFVRKTYGELLVRQKEAFEDAREDMEGVDERLSVLERRVLGRDEMV